MIQVHYVFSFFSHSVLENICRSFRLRDSPSQTPFSIDAEGTIGGTLWPSFNISAPKQQQDFVTMEKAIIKPSTCFNAATRIHIPVNIRFS